jgi:hypothetical protein
MPSNSMIFRPVSGRIILKSLLAEGSRAPFQVD